MTGWSIGSRTTEIDSAERATREDAEDLYRKLRNEVLPPYYAAGRDHWIGVMRHAIAFNASFFNTHRMVQQYSTDAYVWEGTRDCIVLIDYRPLEPE